MLGVWAKGELGTGDKANDISIFLQETHRNFSEDITTLKT